MLQVYYNKKRSFMKIKGQNYSTFEENVEIKYKKKDKRNKIKMKVTGTSVKKLNSIISKK